MLPCAVGKKNICTMYILAEWKKTMWHELLQQSLPCFPFLDFSPQTFQMAMRGPHKKDRILSHRFERRLIFARTCLLILLILPGNSKHTHNGHNGLQSSNWVCTYLNPFCSQICKKDETGITKASLLNGLSKCIGGRGLPVDVKSLRRCP